MMPIRVTRGANAISSNMQFGWMGFPDHLIRNLQQETPLREFMSQAASFLMTWYGIQAGLLHPTIKDVLTQSTRHRAHETKKYNQIPVTRPVFTCRLHTVNIDDVRTAKKQADIDRKTMLWYVIGHWRHYQNGKRVFVQPYWKGPLRETKNAETRERVLPTPKETVS